MNYCHVRRHDNMNQKQSSHSYRFISLYVPWGVSGADPLPFCCPHRRAATPSRQVWLPAVQLISRISPAWMGRAHESESKGWVCSTISLLPRVVEALLLQAGLFHPPGQSTGASLARKCEEQLKFGAARAGRRFAHCSFSPSRTQAAVGSGWSQNTSRNHWGAR